ncbi:hypothetical protein TetV_310 [Tetraselmis virus 1]|uniref:Minor capsid protein P9 transmembrane helices domain-containing protein n=1 Tax=Tetraselmis virus 1 TaxID=2060617 RepID=A0A2P0VND0_9VIRU|nr:hypothetical protein QJ968_gp310 [Tetraselmis virus 1]AUF82402.1 hypothetical protein TetV_310 [Tetraselmis virus 1]
MEAELIWYTDPSGLFTKHNYGKIIPTLNQTYAEQLNSVLRLSIYYGILVSLLKQKIDVLVIPIMVAGITYGLYKSFKREGHTLISANKKSSECIKPSTDNPFMNFLNSDERTREPACDPLDPVVKMGINDKFQKSIFRDIDDVWERNNAGRNFYTTAATTVPNDQTAFAEWCYSSTRAGGKQVRPPRNAIYTMSL